MHERVAKLEKMTLSDGADPREFHPWINGRTPAQPAQTAAFLFDEDNDWNDGATLPLPDDESPGSDFSVESDHTEVYTGNNNTGNNNNVMDQYSPLNTASLHSDNSDGQHSFTYTHSPASDTSYYPEDMNEDGEY